MKFTAKISSRSSTRRTGPPGETEILALNPQRREMILNATGWNEISDGTLNLEVHEDVVCQLLSQEPAIREPGSTVKYPARHQRIPRLRIAYLYFRGSISYSGNSEDVLIRTAENPLKNRLEAFAPVKLRDRLEFLDGDQVVCEIHN